jgi:hypothetical protein
MLKKQKTLKLKLKKKPTAKVPEHKEEAKPSAEELKQRLMFQDESRVRETADRIRRINRPYSLTIGSLPEERRVNDAVKGKMLDQVKTDKKAVRATKRLLPKHELLTKLSSANSAIRRVFEALTYPYVVRGQRLFLFDDTKIDFENWNQEQIEQEMARQRTDFEGKIDIVVQEFYAVAKQVSEKWPDIIEAARSQLDELFDERDYLKPEEVITALYVDFGPEGVLEASTETRFMSSDLQGRDAQRMRDRFEAVVRLQEDVFINTFKDAVDQALKSISAADAGTQQMFHKTVIENLFSTFVDFRNKCLRYGMLNGTRVESAVQECVKALDADNMKVDDVATFIRKSESRRKDAIESLRKTASTMAEVLTERTNSRVIFRRNQGE